MDGEWVEVITDTLVPCVKDNLTGAFSVAYGRSADPSEMVKKTLSSIKRREVWDEADARRVEV